MPWGLRKFSKNWPASISSSEASLSLRPSFSMQWPKQSRSFTRTKNRIPGCQPIFIDWPTMRAIDVHVHPSTRGLDHPACRYFRRDVREVPQTAEACAALYRKHEVNAPLMDRHPCTVN